MKHLDNKILQILMRTGKNERAIRNALSLIRRECPTATLNACAQIYAQKNKTSVLQKLDEEDRASLPHTTIQKSYKIKTIAKKSPINSQIIFNYSSSNYFIQKHIEEINKAFNATCLTSTYILIRKVLENLIIDILRFQFPPTSINNKEIYFDTIQNRYKDFGKILKNLYDRKVDFPSGLNKAIERLYNLLKNFKDDANDKTHSLYHIVTKKKEIEDLDLKTIIQLIVDIEKKIGMK